MQRGGDVLVKFASLQHHHQLQQSNRQIGEVPTQMSVMEWSAMVSQSMAHHGSTESKGDTTSSQFYLVRRARISIEGVGRNAGLFVVDSATTTSSCTGGSANSTTSSNVLNLGNVRFDQVLQSVEQRRAQGEGDEVSIIAKAGEEAYLTAMRFVQRNILHQEISRHIPQDVKIAVALRDRGRCTHIDHFRNDAQRRRDLQYDHRFIPFSLGGPQRIWNLTLYCETHNQAKSDQWISPKQLVEFFGGLLP